MFYVINAIVSYCKYLLTLSLMAATHFGQSGMEKRGIHKNFISKSLCSVYMDID